MLGLAGVKAAKFESPPGQLGGGDLRILAFIDDIVDFATIGVKRSDRPPPLGRQKEKAVIETRAARSCFLLAILFRGHWPFHGFRMQDSYINSARLPISTQSAGRRRGRCRNTSPRTRRICSRMRSPP